MKDIKKIAGINLAVLLAYSAIIRLINGGGGTHGDEGGILFMSAAVIALHIFISLIIVIICFARNKSDLGWAWLLSSGIVLLVGFSTCWGNASF